MNKKTPEIGEIWWYREAGKKTFVKYFLIKVEACLDDPDSWAIHAIDHDGKFVHGFINIKTRSTHYHYPADTFFRSY